MNFKKYLEFLQSIFGSVFNKRIWHGQPNIAHHQGVRDKKIEVGGHTKDPATVRLCQKLPPQRPKKLRKSRFFKRIFFSKSPFLCKLLIGNFAGIFSGTDFAK